MISSNSASLYSILPILVVMATGMLALLGDSCVPYIRARKGISITISLIGIGYAAVLSAGFLIDNGSPTGSRGSELAFNGALNPDSFSQACNLILLLTAALAVLLSSTYLQNKGIELGEYYVLILFSTSGAMLMAAASDLIVLFIGLEILSVALYVLAGFARTEAKSEEAALKYFLLGAFASGFLLYGIALVYGGSSGAEISGSIRGGTTNLDQLAALFRSHSHQVPTTMLMTGVALILVGLAFKAALIPFHMWAPDVYEGAPTSATAYMAAAAKIGAFAAILRVFNALLPIQDYWLIAIQVLAVLTMFGGNILAVTQTNVKRLLAYSSIAHAGYLLVAVSAMASAAAGAHTQALGAAIFYLVAYTLMTVGAFAVLIWLSRRGHDCETLTDLKGLARTDPVAAYTMLVFMLSLGGVPPTMGFMGKWFLFNAAITANQLWLAIALALASMISIYYYLKVVWMMCFQEPDEAAQASRPRTSGLVGVALFVSCAGSIVLGLAPGLMNWLMQASSSLVRP